jgi:hypothetical protein
VLPCHRTRKCQLRPKTPEPLLQKRALPVPRPLKLPQAPQHRMPLSYRAATCAAKTISEVKPKEDATCSQSTVFPGHLRLRDKEENTRSKQMPPAKSPIRSSLHPHRPPPLRQTASQTRPSFSSWVKSTNLSKELLRKRDVLKRSLPSVCAHFFTIRRAGKGWGLSIECPHCGDRPPEFVPTWGRWRWLSVHITTHNIKGTD